MRQYDNKANHNLNSSEVINNDVQNLFSEDKLKEKSSDLALKINAVESEMSSFLFFFLVKDAYITHNAPGTPGNTR